MNDDLAISFNLKSRMNVDIVIFDTEGRLVDKVWSGNRSAGFNRVIFEAGKSLPSGGVYFVRFTTKDVNEVVPFVFEKGK